MSFKKQVALAVAVLGLACQVQSAEAAKLATPDIPLGSSYYTYIDKMEAMGFITDMPLSTKPYSRWYVAKMLAKVNPEGMQPYLRVYYDEMVEALSDEIAYIIVHEPLDKDKVTVKELPERNAKAQARAEEKAEEHYEAYYADIYNETVKQKVQMAAPKHFPSNLGVKSVGVELSYQSMDSLDYRYGGAAKGHQASRNWVPNASYQPLHGNNGGHRYGSGTNIVGTLNIAGSLGNDVAVSLTPRFSYDKDQEGKASLDEGYVRTHTGVWSWTLGKQAQNWGSVGGDEGISLSNNAQANTMLQLGLLEPYDMKDAGWFKFLGKVDFRFFYSRLEKNRVDRYNNWRNILNSGKAEKDNLDFLGMRLEFQPTDTFSFGIERLSHMGKFGKNWLFIRDDGIDDWNAGDGGNDESGFDLRWKFPGVQFYGALHGEDGTTDIGTLFMCHKAARYGIYFPQLVKDGSWDLRMEYTKNDFFWYMHGAPDANGWTFHDDIVGDDMGPDANKYRVVVNNYRPNGDILSLTYQRSEWERAQNGPKYNELAVKYDHRVNKNLHWNVGLGYANIKNAGYIQGRDEKAKYIAAGLNWNF